MIRRGSAGRLAHLGRGLSRGLAALRARASGGSGADAGSAPAARPAGTRNEWRTTLRLAAGSAGPGGGIALAELVERCARDLDRRHPDAGIVTTLAGGAWDARVPWSAGDDLMALLDRALHDRPQGLPIHLFAELCGRRVSVRVGAPPCGGSTSGAT